VRRILNQPGKPTQNDYIESFNGKFGDKHARVEVVRWRTDCNEIRPHSSYGRMPPAKFAAQHRRPTSGAVPAPQLTQE